MLPIYRIVAKIDLLIFINSSVWFLVISIQVSINFFILNFSMFFSFQLSVFPSQK